MGDQYALSSGDCAILLAKLCRDLAEEDGRVQQRISSSSTLRTQTRAMRLNQFVWRSTASAFSLAVLSLRCRLQRPKYWHETCQCRGPLTSSFRRRFQLQYLSSWLA